MTSVVSKQLLPVYDKPMIYYPLSTLMLAGVTEVLIICKEIDVSNFMRLLSKGHQLGLDIKYQIQERPNGIAEALIIGEEFSRGDSVMLILGDNIFYGPGLGSTLRDTASLKGAKVFATQVSDPSRYGVVEFGDAGQVKGLEEKPRQPKSDFAVTGLYVFDEQASSLAKTLRPSARGELEITDLLSLYLAKGQLEVVQLSRGTAWLDMGTIEALHEASEFVKVVERRHGLKIGCPEEVAYRAGLIDRQELAALGRAHGNSAYGHYLLNLSSQ